MLVSSILNWTSIVFLIMGVLVFIMLIRVISKYYNKKWEHRSDFVFFIIISLFIIGALLLIIGTVEMSRDITKSKLPIDKAVAVEINYDSIDSEENAPMAKYNMALIDLKEQTTKVEVVRKKGNNIVYVIYLKNGDTKVVDSKVFYCNCFKI